MILYDASDVAMEFFTPWFLDERIAVFYSKHNLKIELGVGICHWGLGCGALHL